MGAETEPTVVAQTVISPPQSEADKQRWFAHDAAFGLPEGTVRAVIALGVISTDLYMSVVYYAAPEALDTWATVAFTYYFAAAATAGVRASARAATLLVGALLLSAPVSAAQFQTEQITVTNTPVVVGQASGRARVTIKNAGAANSPGLLCGRADYADTAEWYPLTAGESIAIGDGGWFGSTAENVLACASANATPQVVAIIEEGRMPDRTSTPTRTPTPTETPTETPLPTDTPTP